jgi:RND family efflux transporter MFP subunit
MTKRTWLKVGLPLVVIAAGALGAAGMILSREKPETRVPEAPVPLVRSLVVNLGEMTLTVQSQGTVTPRTQSSLVPEVAGRVIEVSDSFTSGGFFEESHVLLRIDPHDYREAVVQANAAVSQAELRLAQQRAEADLAREEWEDLGGGEGSALTLRIPQIAEAEAAVAAASAALDRAERDLARTAVRAPYAGRVREKLVDIGQFVSRGTPVATIYAVDFAEVRLPLPDDQLAFLDLPLDYRGETDPRPGPEVILSADFAGRTYEWTGRIIRTEGEIDPRTRMVHAVARVKDPYARGSDPRRPPLAAGLFVEAQILGHQVSEVVPIPRSAVRDGGRVLVIDDDNRLRFRDVEILRRTESDVIVSSGLAEGDRVCVSSLAAVTDGMRVRVRPGASG